jgi:hypothetical protein
MLPKMRRFGIIACAATVLLIGALHPSPALSYGGDTHYYLRFVSAQEALDYYKRNQIEFMGQAGVAFAHRGANANPGYNRGVAIFTLTRGGLMAEATIAGGWFRYKPLEQAE